MSKTKFNPTSVVGDANTPHAFLVNIDVEGGRCLRGGDGRLGFIKEDRAKIWKEHLEKIMNEENEWDRIVETDLVEGPVKKVARNEIWKQFKV